MRGEASEAAAGALIGAPACGTQGWRSESVVRVAQQVEWRACSSGTMWPVKKSPMLTWDNVIRA